MTGLYGQCYMVELNTLTLPDISVEEHGRVVEGQGMDGSATEHLDCITEHFIVELNTLTLPDVSVEEHGQVVEGQGADGSATEQLVLQNTLTVELNALTLPDISVEKHRLYYRTP